MMRVPGALATRSIALDGEISMRMRGMLATGGRAYPERCVAVESLQPIIGPLIHHLSAVSGLK